MGDGATWWSYTPTTFLPTICYPWISTVLIRTIQRQIHPTHSTLWGPETQLGWEAKKTVKKNKRTWGEKWTSCADWVLKGCPIMKPSISVGVHFGLLLVLMCCPLLGLVQSVSSKKASDNGHTHLGDTDPERCMRHHFVETITHPIYKCNSKVRLKFTYAYTVSLPALRWVSPPDKYAKLSQT